MPTPGVARTRRGQEPISSRLRSRSLPAPPCPSQGSKHVTDSERSLAKTLPLDTCERSIRVGAARAGIVIPKKVIRVMFPEDMLKNANIRYDAYVHQVGRLLEKCVEMKMHKIKASKSLKQPVKHPKVTITATDVWKGFLALLKEDE